MAKAADTKAALFDLLELALLSRKEGPLLEAAEALERAGRFGLAARLFAEASDVAPSAASSKLYDTRALRCHRAAAPDDGGGPA